MMVKMMVVLALFLNLLLLYIPPPWMPFSPQILHQEYYYCSLSSVSLKVTPSYKLEWGALCMTSQSTFTLCFHQWLGLPCFPSLSKVKQEEKRSQTVSFLKNSSGSYDSWYPHWCNVRFIVNPINYFWINIVRGKELGNRIQIFLSYKNK